MEKEIYTGYYRFKTEEDINRELYEYQNPKFIYYADYYDDFCMDSAHIFLNGICHVFAYVLNKKYGYDIFELYDNMNKYRHHFCMCKYNNINVFIDVRGITSDEILFSSQFNTKNASNRKYIRKIKLDDDFKDYSLEFANYIIDKNPEFYDIRKLNI